MPEDNSNFERPRRELPGEPKLSPRTWIVWILVLALVPALMVLNTTSKQRYKSITFSQLLDLTESNRVVHAVISSNPQSTNLKDIKGVYKETDAEGKEREYPFALRTWLHPDDQRNFLRKGFEMDEPNTILLQLLYSLVPII